MSNYAVAFPQGASFAIPQKKKDADGQTVYKDVVVAQGGEVPDEVEESTLALLVSAGIIVPVDADAMNARRSRAAADAPPESASQAAWAAYAVSRGMDEDEANAATKADLVARYGPRSA